MSPVSPSNFNRTYANEKDRGPMGALHAVGNIAHKHLHHIFLEVYEQCFRQHGEDGNEMLQGIVAIDETWIRSFEPELKCKSSEWHTKNSPRPVKFCRGQNCAKMLMIFAYNFRGVLMAHRVPTGEAVNKEYDKMYIRTILRPAIRRKRQGMIDHMA